MARTIRIWFALAVAVISAATADPIVEFASNRGLFGPGNFTDHSNLDVLPALLAGALLVAILVVLRVRNALAKPGSRPPNLLRASGRALGSGLLGLLPAAFGVQIAVLYAMETAEQIAVVGHGFGGTVWLGGPAFVSLAVHAAACVAVLYALAAIVRACANATLRVIRIICEPLAPPANAAPVVSRHRDPLVFNRSRRSIRNIGERAPPFATA